jgi:HAD superfamily hydrolase (TIGR01484 family)
MGRVAAILTDFDGTLCPTSDIKYDYNRSEFIPHSLENILCEVSSTIPISIVTSKDFDFIYPKTKKFAKILSCILGLETFVINDKEQIDQDKNISHDNKKLLLEDVIVTDRISTCDHEILTINSNILSEIAVHVEKNYKKINIEKKFLKSENLLGGITVDWRHNSNWMVNKEKYKENVKKSISIVLNNARQKRGGDISKEKLDFYTQHLFIQEYISHPFIDVYVTKLNKGDAFDFVVSKLSEKSDFHGKIIYLGDSENDNPAFRKSDISIGVNSDNRLNPDLDCTYTIKFENLSTFLRRLVDNGFDFSESLLYF